MEGQLNVQERSIITGWVETLQPEITLEVGTWLGGGSTLHILKALDSNGRGHLWGVEASKIIYDRMIANISSAGADLIGRFTPIFGFSQNVIPQFLAGLEDEIQITFVFLDGGDNPMEQVEEFQLLRDSIPVGGIILSHDAKLRKGKWFVPYATAHDNWECILHDISAEGMLEARKIAPYPSEKSRINYTKLLKKMRMEPIEFLGRILPSSIIRMLLKIIPKSLVLKFTQGRA